MAAERRTCPTCSAEVGPGSGFCDQCGGRVELAAGDRGGSTRRCPTCSASIGAEAPFCDTCGAPVEVVTPPVAAAAEPWVEPEARHWWMLGFSVVTFGLGVAAIVSGTDGLVLGLLLIAAAVGAGALSDLWSRVEVLPVAPKILVWVVATIGGAAASFFVVVTWITLKAFKFALELCGADFGPKQSMGLGTILRRTSYRSSGRREAGDGSDWDRILNANSIGGERIVRDGGFTYIGGKRVVDDSGVTYVGDDKVIREGGVLRIGDKYVTRSGGALFVDGQRVEE